MGTLLQVIFIGGILGLLMVIGIYALIPLAALMYIWRSIYPLIKVMAVWTARGRNYFPFLIILIILFVALILLIFLLLQVGNLLIILPMLALGALFALFGIPFLLGTLVWILKILGWIYGLWQAIIFRFIGPTLTEWKLWLIVNYLRLRIWLEGPSKTTPGVATVSVRTRKTTTTPPAGRVVPPPRTTTTRPTQTVAKPTIKPAPTKKTPKSPFGKSITAWLEAYRFSDKDSKPEKPTDNTPSSNITGGSASQSGATQTESKPSNEAGTDPISSQKKTDDITISTQSKPTSTSRPDTASIDQQSVTPPVASTPSIPATLPTPIPPEQPTVDSSTAVPEMSVRDKLMMKMMTNPVVIKVFSNPLVVKTMTKMTSIYLSITTRPIQKPKKKKIRLDMKQRK